MRVMEKLYKQQITCPRNRTYNIPLLNHCISVIDIMKKTQPLDTLYFGHICTYLRDFFLCLATNALS